MEIGNHHRAQIFFLRIRIEIYPSNLIYDKHIYYIICIICEETV